jgi:hypothetical protein
MSMTEETLTAEAIDHLSSTVRGRVVRPGDADYDEARAVWNGLIDRRPAVIVRAGGTADVIDAVTFARDEGLVLSVRGGGHNAAGSAVNDGGLVIDLSQMKAAHVDPEAGTVLVQGGATWGDLDRETQVHGLAVPGGLVSTTGVGGLTLHGGMGHLRRKHGLSIDNLISADVVTADGRLRRASATENPDLYWAIRGAGSNFGVVTSFEFAAHPVGPTVFVGALFYPLEEARVLLAAWRDFMATAPEEVSSLAICWSVPAAPPFPEEIHGRDVLVIAAVHSGKPEEGEPIVQPLRELSTPVIDLSGPGRTRPCSPGSTARSRPGSCATGRRARWRSSPTRRSTRSRTTPGAGPRSSPTSSSGTRAVRWRASARATRRTRTVMPASSSRPGCPGPTPGRRTRRLPGAARPGTRWASTRPAACTSTSRASARRGTRSRAPATATTTSGSPS